LNRLDPGPCGKWYMHVWGEGGGLPLWFVPLYSCRSGKRDSEGVEATQKRAASAYAGHTTAGSGYQQSEHVEFWKPSTETLPVLKMLTCMSLFISGK
jgi:hypothetical protein